MSTRTLWTIATLAALALQTGAGPAWACSDGNESISEIEDQIQAGYALDRQGEYAKAVEAFKHVINAHPDNRKAHYFLANTYWRDSNFNASRVEWEAVMRMNPTDRIGREAKEWLGQNGQYIKWGPRVQTIAGGQPGFVDGPMARARFNKPSGMVISATGTIFVADTGNHRLRRITPDGMVTTVAGGNTAGFLDGPVAEAQLDAPTGLALDPVGNLYFCDRRRVRFLTPQGHIGTLVGSDFAGTEDGDWQTALLMKPTALATDHSGVVYVADNGTAIRRVTPGGEVRTLAGSASQGYVDGPGTAARFGDVTALQWTAENALLVLDAGNRRVRSVSATGETKSMPGCGENGYVDGPMGLAHFGTLEGMAIDAKGNLLLADAGNFAIRRINEKLMVETLVGGAGGGEADGLGIMAKFREPSDLAVWSNAVYVLDRTNNAIRKITLSPTDG